MDNLNMNNLARSLPSSAIVRAEQETMDRFKAAAQSLTFLYRSSQSAAKRHFDAGYAMALDDLLSVIQHGVSAGPDLNVPEGGETEGMSIGRILDWIEARQESIRLKSREEEEEEEEKEKETKTRSGGTPKSQVGPRMADARDKSMPRPAENVSSSSTVSSRRLSTRNPSGNANGPSVSPSVAELSCPPSPTLTASPFLQSATVLSTSSSRPLTRARLRKHAPLNTTSITSSSPVSDSLLSSDPSMISILGAKRRHAAMLFDHCVPAPVPIALHPTDLGCNAPTSSVISSSAPQHAGEPVFPRSAASNPNPGQRRRLRGSRMTALPRTENIGVDDAQDISGVEAIMDVEDDSGRERKRVARR